MKTKLITFKFFILSILFKDALFVKKFIAEDETSRVVGGKPTTIGNHPYIAAIIEEIQIGHTLKFKDNFHCAVTIVSRNWCLTAAHCLQLLEKKYKRVTEIKNVYIRGDTTKWNNNWSKKHNIILYHIHEKYNSNANAATDPAEYAFIKNNIGVVKVKEPFNGLFEKPIPVADLDFKIEFGKYMGVITGWGKTEILGDIQDELHEVKVLPHTQSYCNFMYGRRISGMFCAGYSNLGSCHQDAGGPFVYRGVLLGIISQDLGCLMGPKSPLYLYLPYYRKWFEYIEVNKLKESMGIKFSN